MLARLAFFLLLIVPPMALAADAPPSAGKNIVVRPSANAAAGAPAPKPSGAPTTMLPQPVAAPPTFPDGSDCRMDCAQRYYACRADDQAGDCSGHWSQCAAACNSPNLTPAFSAAP